MVALLFARDPLGRWTRLEDSIWWTKICIGHPYMRSQLEAVRAALTQLDEIRTNRVHADRECFYRANILTPPLARNYVRVVASFQQDRITGLEEGFVVTAHPIPRIHPKEQHKWP